MTLMDKTQITGISIIRRFVSVPTVISFAVAIVFIYLLANQFNIDWTKAWVKISGTSPLYYILALTLYYISFLFRGARWRILAGSSRPADSRKFSMPSQYQFSQLILIGWFVNSISWFRLGDAYRAYLLSEKSKGGFSWGLGTIFAERVVDMLTVLVMVCAGVISYSVTHDSLGADYILFAAFAMASASIFLTLIVVRFGFEIAKLLPKRVSYVYLHFRQAVIKSFVYRELPRIFALGFIGWLLEVARLYVVVIALDMSIGIPLVFIVALGHAILSTVPTPGGVGAVEPGVTGLLTLGMAQEEAVSVALVDRSITYLSIILFGGIMFLFWQIRAARSKSRR